MIRIGAICIAIACISCISCHKEYEQEGAATYTYDPPPSKTVLDSLAHLWKVDTSGCLGYRSMDNAKDLIKGYHLMGASRCMVEQKLGDANVLIPYNSQSPYSARLVYYLNCSQNSTFNISRLFLFFQNDSLMRYSNPILCN